MIFEALVPLTEVYTFVSGCPNIDDCDGSIGLNHIADFQETLLTCSMVHLLRPGNAKTVLPRESTRAKVGDGKHEQL